jgi:hypothetical protein
MNIPNVKECIKGKAFFEFYRKGFLYYICESNGFKFRVPIEDCGDASFNSKYDKAITLMRYIRKEIAELQKGNE